MQDITKRKQGEEAILAANEELKHLDALKSAFVSTVSHELRTPLAITKEGINLVLDKITGEISKRQEKVLRAAGNNISRLERSINSLLEISQIEQGKRKRSSELVNLVALATQVVSDFHPQVKKKNLEIRTTFSAMHIDLCIDPDDVVQILTNLIDNAIKYTDRRNFVTPESQGLEVFADFIIKEPLKIHLRGPKEATLEPCRCYIEFLDKEARSVNHAYTLLSTEFETQRISHTGNVFQKVYCRHEEGSLVPLDYLRRNIEAQQESEMF